jgi:CBS domain-containing protein
MPIVEDILMNKGRQVQSIDPSATVLDAIVKMNQHKIGALLAIEGGHVAGIFTERDVLHVVGNRRSVEDTTVGEVMTKNVICVEPSTDLEECAQIMKQKKIRHLPVCGEDGEVHGMVSIGDVNAYHATNQEAQIHFLNEYIYGRV